MRTLLAGMLFAFAATGCATVDWDYPRVTSVAFTDTGDTALGRALAELSGGAPDESGFLLIGDGIDAMAVRLVLAAEAERSIDAQYYLWKEDLAGELLLQALLDAADRGVRVRILIDDMLTKGEDESLRAADAHANVDVRVFNAFGRRRWRVLDGVTSFQRVNRRMHNKSFTVDNQATVIGGRNIADEYFAAAPNVNFTDMDAFCVGPVVPEVSRMFDSYWNHERSLPAQAVTGTTEEPEAEIAALQGKLEANLVEVESSRYGAALSSTVLDVLAGELGDLTWCPYELVYDSPDKSIGSRSATAESILTPLRASIGSATDELLIVSPYFVLAEEGRRRAKELVQRGVNVRVITNSLAANNHSAVHSGYAPTRRALLKEGVEFFEARPDMQTDGVRRGQLGESNTTMHTKAFVVDREHLFLGSFNFDPRSAYINTEMGIILSDKSLAGAFVDGAKQAVVEGAWEVTLDEHGALLWSGQRDGHKTTHRKEPKTGFMRRFWVGVLSLLPIKGQL